MTDAELRAIEERANAATPPPWSRLDRHIGQDKYHADTEIRGNPISQFGKVVGHTPVCKLHSGFVWFERDCEFITHVREDVPNLIAYVRELEAALKVESDLSRGDGTDRLLTTLYGESSAATIRHAFGGSQARMLYDAAQEIDKLRAALRDAELRGVKAGLEAAADVAMQSEHTLMQMSGRTYGHPGDSLHTQNRIHDAIRALDPASVTIPMENKP